MHDPRPPFFRAMAKLWQLSNEALLIDTFPHDDPHNEGARILRNGLVISAFNALETYLEEGLEKQVSRLTKSSITYVGFDQDLRSLLTVDALQGIVTRSNFLDTADQIQFVETHLARVAKFGAARPVFTSFGFSPKGSNVGARDITSVLKAFKIKGGWTTLSNICDSLGVSNVSLADRFSNLSKARNSAAHSSSSNVATTDLQSHIETATLVGLSFDIAFSSAINCYVRCKDLSDVEKQIVNSRPDFRFITKTAAGWVESYLGREMAVHGDLATSMSVAVKRRIKAPIVVRDTRQFPLEFIW